MKIEIQPTMRMKKQSPTVQDGINKMGEEQIKNMKRRDSAKPVYNGAFSVPPFFQKKESRNKKV